MSVSGAGIVRAGRDMKSTKVAQGLREGEVFEALEDRLVAGRRRRVRMSRCSPPKPQIDVSF